MGIYIDFETCSGVDLRKAGMYRYAEDPTTRVLCLAVKAQGFPPQLWAPRDVRECFPGAFNPPWIPTEALYTIVSNAESINAWNAGFEVAIWSTKMAQYGFDRLPIDRVHCTMAAASMYSLPRGLDQCCKALGLTAKDASGTKVMLQTCKPHPPLKADKEMLDANGYRQIQDLIYTYKNDDGAIWQRWRHDPESLEALGKYCLHDVEIEYAVGAALPNNGILEGGERAVWLLDHAINARGVAVDTESIHAVRAKLKAYQLPLALRVHELTNGEVSTPTQVAASLQWLHSEGLDLPNLTAQTVADALTKDIPDKCRRLLELRQSMSLASTAKYARLQSMVCNDGRVRGLHQYYGATTGRFSGSGVQVQNLPKACDTEAPEAFRLFGLDELDALYGDVAQAAKMAIRPMFWAPPGKVLVAYDFASIEGRVLAWLAKEEGVLDAYRHHLDLYKIAYSEAFGVGYDSVTKEQRTMGKPIELGLGFGGWIPALRKMADVYGVEFGDDEKCKQIILSWRDSRVLTTIFWNQLYTACLKTVKTKTPHKCGRIRFQMREDWLQMLLPSGRAISYYEPIVTTGPDKFGRTRDALTYMGVDGRQWSPTYKKWVRIETWYGVIVENAVQGIARDLLVEALQRIEADGTHVVMHVHDEIVAEVPEWAAQAENVGTLMAQVPEWAEGLPIEAEGWIGKRYHK